MRLANREIYLRPTLRLATKNNQPLANFFCHGLCKIAAQPIARLLFKIKLLRQFILNTICHRLPTPLKS